MTMPALALLLAAAAAAAAQQPSARPQGRAQGPAVDPAVLLPEARAAYDADPEGFLREHADELETMRRWGQDPALGQEECLAAKKEPRSCMEGRLAGMSAVAKPQALAVINSYVKLLPRGVSAPVPAGPGGPKDSPPADVSAPSSPSGPAAGRSSDFKGGLNTVQFSAVPMLQAAAPPAVTPAPWWQEQYDFYLCFYVPSKCPR